MGVTKAISCGGEKRKIRLLEFIWEYTGNIIVPLEFDILDDGNYYT